MLFELVVVAGCDRLSEKLGVGFVAAFGVLETDRKVLFRFCKLKKLCGGFSSLFLISRLDRCLCVGWGALAQGSVDGS